MSIEKAKIIAKMAHMGQMWGTNSYYEGYVLKVMEKVAKQNDFFDGVNGMTTVALLYEVLGDSSVITEDDLLTMGISVQVVHSVKILTRDRSTSTYFDYIHSIKESGDSWAIGVKIADLEVGYESACDELRYRYTKALEILKGLHDV